MQGVHVFDPHAETVIDLESFVDDDHGLRKIDGLLDMAFVRELTATCYADGLGRPSIDPEVFFPMELVAYYYGITSERRLSEEVRYNLAYRWFCHLSLDDDVPDHSSLSRIRDRYGEKIFESVFREIVALCRKKGLVHEECCVMTDATLIAAEASLNWLVIFPFLFSDLAPTGRVALASRRCLGRAGARCLSPSQTDYDMRGIKP